MIRKKIGKKIEVSPAMRKALEAEFGKTRQTITNALIYKTYSPVALKIRERALEMGAPKVDRYIWLEE